MVCAAQRSVVVCSAQVRVPLPHLQGLVDPVPTVLVATFTDPCRARQHLTSVYVGWFGFVNARGHCVSSGVDIQVVGFVVSPNRLRAEL